MRIPSIKIAPWLAGLMLVLASPSLGAERAPSPFRGSTVAYRNVVGVRTLQPDAEPTYDPDYTMVALFEPSWWLDDVLHTSLRFSVMRELTDADWRYRRRGVRVSDLVARVELARWITDPWLGVALTVGLEGAAPTSEESRRRTLRGSLEPDVQLSRRFDVLGGLEIAVASSVRWALHASTTTQNAGPIIASCAGGVAACGADSHTGVRNAPWTLTHGLGWALQVTDWLDTRAQMGWNHAFLYSQRAVEPTGEGQRLSPGVGGSDVGDVRYGLFAHLEMAAHVTPALAVAWGVGAAHGQRALDGRAQAPLLNRYSALYLDLRLDVARLVSGLVAPGV